MLNNNRLRPHFGLFLGDLNGRYESEVFWGMYRALAEQNVDVSIICATMVDQASNAGTIAYLFEEMIDYDCFDGLIVMTGTIGNLFPLDKLNQILAKYPTLPVVNISVPMGSYPTIMIENYAGMMRMMTHLIQVCGHQIIAFVRGPKFHFEANERYRAYRDALSNHGLPFSEQWVVQGNFEEQAGERAVDVLLKERGLSPDVIVCASDDMGLGVIRHLAQMDLNVPEDIGVTGFDDVLMARFASSPLTTVAQCHEQISQLAVRALNNLVAGTPVGNLVLEPPLVIRESCCSSCKTLAQSRARNQQQQKLHSELLMYADEARLGKMLEQNGRRLAYCMSPEELASSLAAITKRMAIEEKTCLCVYDNMRRPTQQKRLLSCEDGDWITYAEEPFTSIKVPLFEHGPEPKRVLFIPMHVKDFLMGCMQVPIGPQNSRIYESLRGHVASAMGNLIFMQQMQAQNEELELKVAERTDQLVDLLEQKQDMLGIVAHDLRSPLTSIGLSVDMLRMHRQKLSPEAIERQLERIRQASSNMLMHIERLLNENQDEETGIVAKIESVHLLPLVEQVVSQERIHAEVKQIGIRIAERKSETYAQVDAQLLMMSLANIINNAVKYTPSGKCIDIQLLQDESGTQIHVLDEGCGITVEDKAKMFGRYVKLSASPTAGEESNGFGLYGVKRMVDAMGGMVSAENRTDTQGSIFSLTFPNLPRD